MDQATPKFLIGELVQLRSGGPSMTIINIEEARPAETNDVGRKIRPARKAFAYCRWFDGNAVMHQSPFPFASLISVDPDKPQPETVATGNSPSPEDQ